MSPLTLFSGAATLLAFPLLYAGVTTESLAFLQVVGMAVLAAGMGALPLLRLLKRLNHKSKKQ